MRRVNTKNGAANKPAWAFAIIPPDVELILEVVAAAVKTGLVGLLARIVKELLTSSTDPEPMSLNMISAKPVGIRVLLTTNCWSLVETRISLAVTG